MDTSVTGAQDRKPQVLVQHLGKRALSLMRMDKGREGLGSWMVGRKIVGFHAQSC